MKIYFQNHANGDPIEEEHKPFVEFHKDGTISQNYWRGGNFTYRYERTAHRLYQEVVKDPVAHRPGEGTTTDVWITEKSIVVSIRDSCNRILLDETQYQAVLAWCNAHHPLRSASH